MANRFDVIIVGGGLVGSSLGAALARTPLKIALVEPHPPKTPPSDHSIDIRVYAISPGIAQFLQRSGAWQRVAPERVARVETMLVYGDDPGASLEFSAYDAGLRELAFIVENRQLQTALWQQIEEAGNIQTFTGVRCAALAWESRGVTLDLADGTTLPGALIVGADGEDSWVRSEAGIAAPPADYGERGVVANLATAKPHRDTAYQWFRPDGVLAFLPLPGQRISMVWSTPERHAAELLQAAPRDLAERVEAASRSILGPLELLAPPAAFPLKLRRVPTLVRPRLALVGDAAHNVHPLAGQGVNLGLRDARELSAVLEHRGAQPDCGDYYLLRRYERARREDIVSLQLVTDGLQKLFARQSSGIKGLRNIGLGWVNTQPWLKKFFVRRAVA